MVVDQELSLPKLLVVEQMLFQFAHLELLGAVDDVHDLPGPKHNKKKQYILNLC